jgi:hypothetical protein
MKRFLYVCVGSAVGILGAMVVNLLLMALLKQLGISHRQPVFGYLVLAIFVAGWATGWAAGWLIHFRKYHVHRMKTK